MKVKFFEKKIMIDYAKIISILSTIISFLLLFIPDLCQCLKNILFIILLVIFFVIYVIIYFKNKTYKKVKLNINNTKVNIFFADIFNQKGMKVIGFNEYFDTVVDGNIIVETSLNGQLVKKMGKEKIDKSLKNDKNLRHIEENNNRKPGKSKKYKLGTIHKIEEYFILAFTHFNDKNEAYLYSNDYAQCLLEMWKHLNEKYSQEEVYIPLLGGGITRIIDNKIVEDQELLEIMLNTLKISKQTFKEPSTINIVLSDKKNNFGKFNLSKIKYMFK